MIEEIMIFLLGFLVAGLLSLFVLPLFWRRALRLSRRRVEMQMPLSMSEVFADRDHLRAEHAVERCRLENSLAELTEKQAQAMGRAGRAEAVALALREKLAKSDASLSAAERLGRELEAQIASLAVELHDSCSSLQLKSETLVALEGQHRSLSELADERRALTAALETRLSALEMRFADALREAAAAKSAAVREAERAKALESQRGSAQRSVDALEREKYTLERTIAAADRQSEEASRTLERALAELAEAKQEHAALSRRAAQAEERATVLRTSLDRHSELRHSQEQELAERLVFSEAKVVELKAALEQARESDGESRRAGSRRRASSRTLKGLEVVSSQSPSDELPDPPSRPEDSVMNRPA